MVFDARTLARIWLGLTAIALAVAGPYIGLPWLGFAGWPILFGIMGYSIVRGKVNIGEFASGVLKSLGLVVALIAGIVAVFVMMSFGGIFLVAGYVLLGAAMIVGIGFLLRSWFSFLFITAASTHEIVVKGRGDFIGAALHSGRGRWAEGIEVLERYERSHPGDPASPAQRAFIYLCNDRLEDAAAEAVLSMSIKETAVAYSVRGQTLLRAGAAREALADFERALSLDRKQLFVGVASAAALLDLRALQGAAVKAKAYDRSQAKWTWTANIMGDAYRLMGDERGASAAYRRAMERAKRDIRCSIYLSEPLLGYAAAHLGQLEMAEKVLSQAADRGVDPAAADYGLALVALKKSDTNEVGAALERLVPQRPHLAVTALTDPLFTPLLREERFVRLLGQALHERDSLRARVLSRLRLD